MGARVGSGAGRAVRAETERTLAVLLRSVDYGEADRIVTLLTERRGRVSVLARSARKSTKRFLGALEPFGVIEAEIALGTAEVGRLSSARLVRGFPKILASLSATMPATLVTLSGVVQLRVLAHALNLAGPHGRLALSRLTMVGMFRRFAA